MRKQARRGSRGIGRSDLGIVSADGVLGREERMRICEKRSRTCGWLVRAADWGHTGRWRLLSGCAQL